MTEKHELTTSSPEMVYEAPEVTDIGSVEEYTQDIANAGAGDLFTNAKTGS